MKDKFTLEEDDFSSEESNPIKPLNSLKFDNELYKSEDDVKHKLYNVKVVPLPNNGINWDFYENGEKVFTLKGTQLTKGQCKNLSSPQGLKFLLDRLKSGTRTVSSIKDSYKKEFGRK